MNLGEKFVIKIYEDGRIAIPKKILREYGVMTGDVMIGERQRDGIKLIPAKVQARKGFEI